MSLKRRQLGSGTVLSRVEALESRQLLSASLVQITIPTTPVVKKVVAKPHKVVKPKVVHKAVKPKVASGEQHANIGYEVFAG